MTRPRLGAVAALEKTGRADKVKVIGFDGQMEARKAIKEGKIYADAIQYPDKIAQMTIDTIRKYMAGEKVPVRSVDSHPTLPQGRSAGGCDGQVGSRL